MSKSTIRLPGLLHRSPEQEETAHVYTEQQSAGRRCVSARPEAHPHPQGRLYRGWR